ncbi:MAG TPA: hypothetical protein VKU41_05100 [Polyangiaceae bacterium]|nr:hypothetical protein [Polyangiaceae bacterium]
MSPRKGFLWVVLPPALLLLTEGGCGPTTTGIAGVSCIADGDCNAGLRCLEYQGFADAGDAGCSSAGRECLRPCQSDSDCDSLGPGLVCFAACGTPACEVPGMLGVPLASEAGADASTDTGHDAPVGVASE